MPLGEKYEEKFNCICEWGTNCKSRFLNENELYDHVIKVKFYKENYSKEIRNFIFLQ